MTSLLLLAGVVGLSVATVQVARRNGRFTPGVAAVVGGGLWVWWLLSRQQGGLGDLGLLLGALVIAALLVLPGTVWCVTVVAVRLGRRRSGPSADDATVVATPPDAKGLPLPGEVTWRRSAGPVWLAAVPAGTVAGMFTGSLTVALVVGAAVVATGRSLRR